MAERRMMSKQIIDSDAFLDMPATSQLLYFHMLQRADDDGFINNPKKIQRMIGCSEDDLKLLIVKNFIIPFESGIVVIKHWRIHNYIRNDRYKSTAYVEEKAKLELKDNGAYTLVDTIGIPNGYQMDTQDSIGKVSIGKVSIEEDIKPSKHRFGEYSNVLLTMEEYDKLKNEIPQVDKLIDNLSEYIASKGAKYKSHYATLKAWYRRDKDKAPAEKPAASYDIEEFTPAGYKKPVYKGAAE